ncbi:hypothetical protein DFQ05_1466 [Winogradskyella wandonensis]|uniref:Uncharacterized protein n=1 Tax=Winogradskyella wandonensis TaxID=1442586 RepID=A0A4R1KSX2_9FLAO|nr:hypothetical protein DFQ05_1466 [Winogradskyella wandonensis]
MKNTHKSLFNLIGIFRNTPKRIVNTISPSSHCEHKFIHDYYCDSEQPFISQK